MAPTSGADAPVVVYWRPGCPYCMTLRRGLRRRGLVVDERNIWDDPEAARFVRSVNAGNETVPTVVVAGTVLVNPSPREVAREVQHDRARRTTAGEETPNL